MSFKKEVEEEELEIRGRMDIEDIVKYQINRCNIASSHPEPEIFNSNVLALLDNLPIHKRMEVLDRHEEYEYTAYIDVRSTWCGQKCSIEYCEENDILAFEKIIEIDYHLLYRVVLDAYADSGLTWKIEPELKELGKIITRQKKPTPYLKEEKNNVGT